MFIENGFAATSMEEIAESADVGVGTVYNYFRSKNDLLIPIICHDIEKMLEEGEKVLNPPQDDPMLATTELFYAYARSFRMYRKELMREILAVVLKRFATSEEMRTLNSKIVTQIIDLLSIYQLKGLIDKDVHVQDAAIVLYGAFFMQFKLFITIDGTSMEELKKVIRVQIELIYQGFSPLNSQSIMM